MTMDIVERLRATPETGADPDLIFDAADQLERMHEALRRLREWGGLGTQKYSATVAFGVTDWIDSGMEGELPPLPDYATPNVKVSGGAPTVDESAASNPSARP